MILKYFLIAGKEKKEVPPRVEVFDVFTQRLFVHFYLNAQPPLHTLPLTDPRYISNVFRNYTKGI